MQVISLPTPRKAIPNFMGLRLPTWQKKEEKNLI